MISGDKHPSFLSAKSQSSLETCVFWNVSMLFGFGDGLVIVRKIRMARFVVCNSAITSFLCVTILNILLLSLSVLLYPHLCLSVCMVWDGDVSPCQISGAGGDAGRREDPLWSQQCFQMEWLLHVDPV